jgi:hypothetical protein
MAKKKKGKSRKPTQRERRINAAVGGKKKKQRG